MLDFGTRSETFDFTRRLRERFSTATSAVRKASERLTDTFRDHEPLAVVQHVDLTRYTGTWFEIAALPQPFEHDCVASTATYGLRDDGTMLVLNRCREGGFDGPKKFAEGKAWVADESTNAKLKVQFAWPFRGDYWILELGPDYQYAVVGDPSRRSLWVLSRTPQMTRGLYEDICERMGQKGFDIDRLRVTPQLPKDEPTIIAGGAHALSAGR